MRSKELKTILVKMYNASIELEQLAIEIKKKKPENIIKTKDDIVKLLQSYHLVKNSFIDLSNSFNSMFYPETEN